MSACDTAAVRSGVRGGVSGRSRSVSFGPFFVGEGHPVALVVSGGVVGEDFFGKGDECRGCRIGGGGGGGDVGFVVGIRISSRVVLIGIDTITVLLWTISSLIHLNLIIHN